MKAKVAVLGQRERERELCESRGGRPGPERESCVKFEVAVLGQRERERERWPSLIVLVAPLDVKLKVNNARHSQAALRGVGCNWPEQMVST